MIRNKLLAMALLFALPFVALAQGRGNRQQGDGQPNQFNRQQQNQQSQQGEGQRAARPLISDEAPVVTQHSIMLHGKELKYTATTGYIPIKNRQTGESEAHMFFVAYTVDGAPKESRPVTFAFNGGPGSASVFVHMGAMGPKRVKMLDDGAMPPPPYQLEDNQNTWLDQTDLVFIDAIGTGYSRPDRPDLGAKFWGVRGDIEAFGEFVRMYITHYQRWASPLFIAGESYGTTRAAGLAGYLVDNGIAVNGVVLISTVLNFQTIRFGVGNDLPYVLFLPTYTAAAWYHHKLPADLQGNLKKTLDEVRKWAETDYTVALQKGDKLTPVERTAVIEKLNRYTGLDKDYIDKSNLRIEIFHFDTELLRDEKRTVGRLDSRFKGYNASNIAERPDFDPANTALNPPYDQTFNNYVHNDLGFKSDLDYVLSGGIGRWDYGIDQGYADTSQMLRSAFAKNPYLKVHVVCGYYDLATPFFAAEYTMNHMGVDPSLKKNITFSYYEAGHMVYIDQKAHAQLKKEVSGFIQDAMENNTEEHMLKP
ncbi:MAG TPA: peptidase S10 [Blastocatellia bacterium]|nr:peptidase S10 [Blastocatellia bacterium]